MGIQRWGKDGVDYRLVKSDEGNFVMFTDHEQVVAELTKAHQDNLDSWLHQREEIAFLRAELAAKSRDAERYQWLLSQMTVGAVQTQLPLYRAPYLVMYEPCDDAGGIEEAIDAAMGEGNGR